MRAWAFDRRYAKPGPNPEAPGHSSTSATVKIVERYARKGHILDMGCGKGDLAQRIDRDCFASYLGVDVSPSAIETARKMANEKIAFALGDLAHYQCTRKYDLILFEESLYYIPFFRERLLKRYIRSLRPGGVLVVTVAHPAQFGGMIRMIRRNFEMIEDRWSSGAGGGRLLLVFR
jgi:trans-aconitate methyltransferase